jgi:hypothetical protein
MEATSAKSSLPPSRPVSTRSKSGWVHRADLTFGGYEVQLRAGGALLAQDNNTLAVAAGIFEASTVVFSALATDPNLGSSLEIRLVSFGV